MAEAVMAYILMAGIAMTHRVVARKVMAYVGMACVVMAHIAMT